MHHITLGCVVPGGGALLKSARDDVIDDAADDVDDNGCVSLAISNRTTVNMQQFRNV